MVFGQNESVHRVLYSILIQKRPGRPSAKFGIFNFFQRFFLVIFGYSLALNVLDIYTFFSLGDDIPSSLLPHMWMSGAPRDA